MRIFNALFERKTEVGPSVKSFYFSVPEGFTYKPGQYGIFELESGGGALSKPFSFSSPPGTPLLEITTIMSGSDYKNALDALEKGESIRLRGPAGSFTLEAAEGRDICFLAGGIGVTPVKSIIQAAAENGSLPDTVLIYANRNVERIVFRDIFEELERETPGLRVVNAVSSLEGEDPGLPGFEPGRIDDSMIKRRVPGYSERQFYSVGPPPFTRAMLDAASRLGIESGRVTTEKFAGY